MSQPPYGTWPTGVKTEHGQFSGNAQMTASRRTASADSQSTSFAYADYSQRRMQSRTGMRAHSSSTSSLAGAMDDARITVQPRTSVTPPSGLASWTPSPTSSTMSTAGYMPVSEESSMSYLTPITSASPSGAFGYSQYNMMFGSPETSPASPGYADQLAYQQSRAASSAMVISPSGTPAPRHSHSPQDKEDELRRLQQRNRELEIVAESSRRRIRELELELSRGVYTGGLPSPLPTPAPPPTFDQEWRARTEARTKLYCSLNRAGNALCAWHDSRRERRAFPPRMAPPGYLNCGCTYDEALFEESLARHGVGSYLPGESVRMDPALRNPLLKLLQQRYHYRDGDFERDPVTGNWVEGEGAAKWEQKLAAGSQSSRRRGPP
ncbi:hypothetical protein K466DRAFT_485823 [Polyporus arcularius HHB13444]|uniref:Uncharacterized protein n=1 Tax=Polyporus arcularius HHB13444 TaxID=1314778 RepID=A0A5C3PJC1_9APHY|nr:hypothetical protein K466DRAFT_485823 [Polyporus arcularius HHB13444]